MGSMRRSRPLVAVLLGSCSAALISGAVARAGAGPDSSLRAQASEVAPQQAGKKHDRRRGGKGAPPAPKPTDLWSLYPLNPAKQAPGLDAVQDNPGPVPAGGAASPQPRVAPVEGSTGNEGSTGTDIWVPGLAIAAAAALLLGLAVRLAARSRRPVALGASLGGYERAPPAHVARASGAVPAPKDANSTPETGQPAAAGATSASGGDHHSEAAREHVRVHLADGRAIEGWKRESHTRDQRVLMLDVERVLDAKGEETPSRPLDSFVLPPQVDHIELLDEQDETRAGARRND
jgi:hypothetical protein